MRTLARFVVGFLILSAGNVDASRLALPPGSGGLAYERFDEYIETIALRRLRFSGVLNFTSDAPTDFVFVARPTDGAALQLRHYLLDGAAILFHLYPNAGQTRFDAEALGRLLANQARTLGARVEVVEITPFDAELHPGPPVFGTVSLQSVLQLREVHSGKEFRQWFVVVPVPESKLIMVTSLWAEAELFSAVQRNFRQFVSSFYLD